LLFENTRKQDSNENIIMRKPDPVTQFS